MTFPSVYKIFKVDEWAEFKRTGCFGGSPTDCQDGFIHLSTGLQLRGTLDTYFTDGSDIIIAQIEPSDLGSALKYERSRNGDNFPHLYGSLLWASVLRHERFLADGSGHYTVSNDFFI